MEIIFACLGVVIFANVLLFRRAFRKRNAELIARRASLWFDRRAKLYRWVEPSGQDGSAPQHPDRPGGIWYDSATSSEMTGGGGP
jgi:hypothetical protein